MTDGTQSQLELSYSSAADLAAQNPAFSDQILAAARSSFIDGDQWAYLAAMVAVMIGGILVFLLFPKKQEEEAMRAEYKSLDQRGDSPAGSETDVAA